MSVLESLLQKMLDTTGDLVVVVDDQGRYEWVNEGAARFYGMTRAELAGCAAVRLMRSPAVPCSSRGADAPGAQRRANLRVMCSRGGERSCM